MNEWTTAMSKAVKKNDMAMGEEEVLLPLDKYDDCNLQLVTFFV